MLSYASWSDLKTREVSDLTWLVFGSLGAVLDLRDVAAGVLSPMGLAIPVLFSTALSFALGYMGLFGGADFKAFVVLALLQPHPSSLIKPALGILSVVYPLTIFSNSAIAGASFAIVLLFRNLTARKSSPLFEGFESEASWRKFVILISGVKRRLDLVKGPPFEYPLEVPSQLDDGARRLVLMPSLEDDDAALEIFEGLKKVGVSEVWVSHTLPFIVFISFGYISSFLLGDVALWVLIRILLAF
jgi:preflagellin peptidase FlaK